jgi:hypothetical protein
MRLQGLTVALVLLAATAFELAQIDRGSSLLPIAGNALVEAAIVLAAAWCFRRANHLRVDAPIISPILIAVVVLTFVWEPFSRWMFDAGKPFELLVMTGMRNLMLGLAAAACWRRYEHLAGILSMFLVLFSSTLASQPAFHVLVAVYAAVGVWWLAAMHWEKVRVCLLATHATSVPRPWLILVPALAVIVFVGVAGWDRNRVLSVAAGILPSSGGDGSYDPFAAQGVGDGDALVAGTDHIQSFAPIEDAPFRASDEPSLYDLFNDLYEKPFVPKRVERAVALPPEFAGAAETRMANSEQAGREFSTLRRRGRKRDQSIGDLRSAALFYVAGRTPLHLRMELYDLFDGVQWLPEPDEERALPMTMNRIGKRPWLVFPSIARALDSIATRETHALKVVNLDTSRIPSPAQLRGIHIDLVDDATMFRWSQPGMVSMTRECLPPSVPIHLASVVIDPRQVDRECSAWSGGDRRYQALPVGHQMIAIENLARAWGAGYKRGWSQVEAIAGRLRESYVLDRDARPPADCEFPLADFLLESRRGPDYQFATAAAVLLRTLGYSTRVVSGFYVDPQNYDARRRHTSVHREDVHFWAEVFVSAGTWQTVEAAPGYEVLEPPPGLLERLAAAGMAAWLFAADHAAPLVCGLAVVVILLVNRIALLDRIQTSAWRLRDRGDSRQSLLSALRVLDRRLRWAGLARPHGHTPAGWFFQRVDLERDASVTLSRFFELADWAAFAPDGAGTAQESPAAVRGLCDSALRLANMQRLQPARSRLSTRVAFLWRWLQRAAIEGRLASSNTSTA